MQRLQPNPRLLLLPILVTLLVVYHVYSSHSELGSTHLRSPPHATPYRILNGTALPRVAPLSELPRVHLFMPMDKQSSKRNLRFCRAVESAVVNGWEINVFNWEEEINFLQGKVFGLAHLMDSAKHTANISEDDLIFMIDASDVWLQLSPIVMARRFLEYDSDVLVSTQKACWPNAKSSAHYQDECLHAPQSLLPVGLYHDHDDESGLSIYRPKGMRPQYANSGSIIGRLKAMRPLYESLIEVIQGDVYQFDGDQGAFNVLLGQHKLRLDYWSRLFWAADEDLTNLHFMNTRYPPDPTTYDDPTTPWELYPALAHHSKTGEVPVAVHLNGPKKKRSRLEEMWGNQWWNSDRARFRDIVRNRMDQGVVRIATAEGYRSVGVREICPMLDVWEWDGPSLPLDGL